MYKMFNAKYPTLILQNYQSIFNNEFNIGTYIWMPTDTCSIFDEYRAKKKAVRMKHAFNGLAALDLKLSCILQHDIF